jgi:hypothetical protein
MENSAGKCQPELKEQENEGLFVCKEALCEMQDRQAQRYSLCYL